jgi:hypothetical protein
MERWNEPAISPTRVWENSASNQWSEMPFIGKVMPPCGPWNDRM